VSKLAAHHKESTVITYWKFGDLPLETFFIYKGQQYQKVDDPTGSGMEFNCYNIDTQTYVQLGDDVFVGVEKKVNI
jgi:hypothetical protein